MYVIVPTTFSDSPTQYSFIHTHSKYHKERVHVIHFFSIIGCHKYIISTPTLMQTALSLTSSSSTLSSIDSQLTKLCTTPSLSQLFQETYCNYCNKRIAMKKLFRQQWENCIRQFTLGRTWKESKHFLMSTIWQSTKVFKVARLLTLPYGLVTRQETKMIGNSARLFEKASNTALLIPIFLSAPK